MVSSFIVYTYSIELIDCIGFDHTLYYFIFSYFCCKYVNKRSVQFSRNLRSTHTLSLVLYCSILYVC